MQLSIQFSNEIKKQFTALNIEAVILFGSRAMDIARPNSDIDIGILVPIDKHTLQNHRKIYDLIYDYLSNNINQKLNFDIVFLDDAPVELQVHTIKNGIVLFESKENVFVKFKERVMFRAADFAPYQAQFEKSTLVRI